MHKYTLLTAACAVCMVLSFPSTAADGEVKFTQEYLDQAKTLSPEMLKRFGKIDGKHKRRSDSNTLRQTMFELNSDLNCMIGGILINNLEMAAECADRVSHHRWPKGGIFPYMDLDLINNGTLAWLPTINKKVEVGADKIAEAARAGDAVKAASLVGGVIEGCAECHSKAFRRYGESKFIVD